MPTIHQRVSCKMVGTLRSAHPHMRAFESSIPTGLGRDFLRSVEWRRAEPCVAQRAATVGALRDWLPAIYAAAHCITSYPVGSMSSVPTFRMHAARKPRG